MIDKICEGVTSPEEMVKEMHGRIINRHGRETIIAIVLLENIQKYAIVLLGNIQKYAIV